MKLAYRRHLQAARSEMAGCEIVCLDLPRSHTRQGARLLAGFAGNDMSELALRLFTQWLSDHFGREFTESSARGDGSLAFLLVSCDNPGTGAQKPEPGKNGQPNSEPQSQEDKNLEAQKQRAIRQHERQSDGGTVGSARRWRDRPAPNGGAPHTTTPGEGRQ